MTLTTHGESVGYHRSTEFGIWTQMVARCHKPNSKRYADYGGRGIYVCKRWLDSVENFIADMGRRPSHDMQLERIDNDGPYCAANCRWATRVEQGRNKRNNILILHHGRIQPLSAWAEELNLPYATLLSRKQILGWSDDETLTTPIGGMDRRAHASEYHRRTTPKQCDALYALVKRGPLRLKDIPGAPTTSDLQRLARRGLVVRVGAGIRAPWAATNMASVELQRLAKAKSRKAGS